MFPTLNAPQHRAGSNQCCGKAGIMTAGGTSGTCSWQLSRYRDPEQWQLPYNQYLHCSRHLSSRTSITNDATTTAPPRSHFELLRRFHPSRSPHSRLSQLCVGSKETRGCGTCFVRRHSDQTDNRGVDSPCGKVDLALHRRNGKQADARPWSDRCG